MPEIAVREVNILTIDYQREEIKNYSLILIESWEGK
jgi:hypothetical protein